MQTGHAMIEITPGDNEVCMTPGEYRGRFAGDNRNPIVRTTSASDSLGEAARIKWRISVELHKISFSEGQPH